MKNGLKKKTATSEAPELDFTGLYRASTELFSASECTMTPETEKEHTDANMERIEPNMITLSESKYNHAYEVYRQYQENILKAQQIRTEILKGLDAGTPDRELLLKACEALSRMTGDRVFLELVQKKM